MAVTVSPTLWLLFGIDTELITGAVPSSSSVIVTVCCCAPDSEALPPLTLLTSIMMVSLPSVRASSTAVIPVTALAEVAPAGIVMLLLAVL